MKPKRKWVPEHREYDPRLGQVIVEGHYIKYQVQKGGHWQHSGKDKRHSYHY
ncbi:hypothetical protein ACFL1I_02665 [Candidatus Omnitrophota bacterium]